MTGKLEILTLFRAHQRSDLQAKYVQATTLHWGLHIEYGETKAFKVLRDEGKDIG